MLIKVFIIHLINIYSLTFFKNCKATGGVFTDLSYIDPQPDWSAARNSEWGYGKFSASNTVFHYEFIHQDSGEIVDQFTLTKSP